MFFAIFCTFVFTPSFFNLPKLPSFSYWLECWGTSSKPLPTVGVFANFFSRVRSQETEILISPPHRARGWVVSPLVTTKEDEKNWHEPNFFLHWCIAYDIDHISWSRYYKFRPDSRQFYTKVRELTMENKSNLFPSSNQRRQRFKKIMARFNFDTSTFLIAIFSDVHTAFYIPKRSCQ